MKKSLIYTTGAILTATSISGISLFSVYYSKNKTNQKALYDLRNKDINIKITSYDTSKHLLHSKIYAVAKNEFTLADLFKDHPEDFTTETTKYGAMIKTVFNSTSPAYSPGNSWWWQLASPTYALRNPSQVGQNGQQSTLDDSLNFGASEFPLLTDEIIDLYQTPS